MSASVPIGDTSYGSGRSAASFHAVAASAIGEELGPPFKRGRGGPGGWVILFEPELHLGGDALVPDLAGWRRERMPQIPDTAVRRHSYLLRGETHLPTTCQAEPLLPSHACSVPPEARR
jgi:hypothetical protein